MRETTEKTDGAGQPASSPGAIAGLNCSQKNTSAGAFAHVGRVEILPDRLRIEYRTFGITHSAMIRRPALDRLVNERWTLPADVLRDQDGEIVKIGTAYRSRSGRALIIRVTDAPGDLSVPWRCLVDLISGITQAAPISILIPPPRPSPAPVMNSNPITAGLARGF